MSKFIPGDIVTLNNRYVNKNKIGSIGVVVGLMPNYEFDKRKAVDVHWISGGIILSQEYYYRKRDGFSIYPVWEDHLTLDTKPYNPEQEPYDEDDI